MSYNHSSHPQQQQNHDNPVFSSHAANFLEERSFSSSTLPPPAVPATSSSSNFPRSAANTQNMSDTFYDEPRLVSTTTTTTLYRNNRQPSPDRQHQPHHFHPMIITNPHAIPSNSTTNAADTTAANANNNNNTTQHRQHHPHNHTLQEPFASQQQDMQHLEQAHSFPFQPQRLPVPLPNNHHHVEQPIPGIQPVLPQQHPLQQYTYKQQHPAQPSIDFLLNQQPPANNGQNLQYGHLETGNQHPVDHRQLYMPQSQTVHLPIVDPPKYQPPTTQSQYHVPFASIAASGRGDGPARDPSSQGPRPAHPDMEWQVAAHDSRRQHVPPEPSVALRPSFSNPGNAARLPAAPAAVPPSTRSKPSKEEILRTFFDNTLGGGRYEAEKIIGEGAYGIVIAAFDKQKKERVAVKRIRHCLESHPMFTRTLRELKFLRLLSPHQNIINVRDILVPGELDKFNDTFVVLERMSIDLSKVLKGRTVVTPSHVKYFMFQLLSGVHYMHSANVFHRDLKPHNILINEKCELRICDFGLARASFESGPDTTRFWTDYVATRWYRAPELIMEDHSTYSTAIDMWSVGCIFAEMLSGGKVLFQGNSATHMFELITDVLGSPPRHVVDRLRNQSAKRVLNQFLCPHREPRDLRAMFPSADHMAIDLLSRLLVFDQEERVSAWDALQLPYFSEYWHLGFGATAEPLSAEEFYFEKARLTDEQKRREFLSEILHYHPNESLSSLLSTTTSNSVVWHSPAEKFKKQFDELIGAPAHRKNYTLQERSIERLAGNSSNSPGQSLYASGMRQHPTMGEKELQHFNRRW